MATSTVTEQRKLTTSLIAAKYRINVTEVIAWIRSGELRAFNVAHNPRCKRPRYRIDPDDLADFERRRAVPGPAPKPTRRRRTPAGVTKYS